MHTTLCVLSRRGFKHGLRGAASRADTKQAVQRVPATHTTPPGHFSQDQDQLAMLGSEALAEERRLVEERQHEEPKQVCGESQHSMLTYAVSLALR